MRPIRSAIPALLASVIMATSLAGCQFGDAEQETGEILIGADLELSGAAAQVGKAYQRALELKVEQVNKSGVLGGRKLRLDVRDNRFDQKVSESNIGDFTSNPAVNAIIMGSCNECAISAAKTVNDKRVPTIALAPASEVAAPAVDRRYMFKLGPNAQDNAAALVSELTTRKAEQVALLHTDDKYGQEGLRTLTTELEKADITLVRARAVQPTDTDVSQAVRALLTPDPDTVIVWTPAEQATLASASLAEAKFTGDVFFDGVAAGDLFLGSGPRSAENTTMVFTQTMAIDDVIATTPAKAARKQWFLDYTARFGGYYGYSSFAADAVQLVVDAILRASDHDGTPSRDTVRGLLETSETDGLSGPIRMTPENHSGLMPQALTLLVARGGRWRLAG
ncbi:ABC transporter substrate-binding protein [Plantactinospora sp. B5E13]|uniref:ABC transporter substrate-binding protein n=1 Tax=unclassified Plantactinospora TaxID=2631981 RepID=UPI00325ED754